MKKRGPQEAKEASSVQLVTLKKNREFSFVYSRGKSCATRLIALVYVRRKFGGVRAGFSVSKKIGCSVQRNRVRRRLKESFRALLPEIEGSVQLIFIARVPIGAASFQEISRDMRYLLKKAGFLPKEKAGGKKARADRVESQP